MQPTTELYPSPRARFQTSADNISKHKKLTDQPELQRAFDFALLEYIAFLSSKAQTPNDASVMGIKIQGVHEFIDLLKKLGDMPTVPASTVNHGLNHKV